MTTPHDEWIIKYPPWQSPSLLLRRRTADDAHHVQLLGRLYLPLVISQLPDNRQAQSDSLWKRTALDTSFMSLDASICHSRKWRVSGRGYEFDYGPSNGNGSKCGEFGVSRRRQALTYHVIALNAILETRKAHVDLVLF